MVAASGYDVAGGAAFDQTDVGGGALLDQAELHLGDRRRGRGDRRTARLGLEAGVGLDTGEGAGNGVMAGRGDDHLSDVGRVVHHESHLRPDRREVEGRGTAQPLFLGHSEQQLDPQRRRLLPVSGGEFHQYRDRGLVVGAEDGLSPAPVDPVIQYDLDRTLMGNRVQVGTEHDEARLLAGDPRQQVAAAGPGRAGRVVLVNLETERFEFGADHGGHFRFLPGRAGDLTQPRETAHSDESIKT